MSDELRQRIAEVLYDFREGLLDSVEDGVDRIVEITKRPPPPRSTAAVFDPR